MKNKLAYLGFLGLLGFTGFFATPLLFAFFGLFGFFVYERVIPDELFWANVRICATRGFFAFLVPAFLIIAVTLLMRESEALSDHALVFATRGFALALSASTFVFGGTLEYLERKEKKSKDEEGND